MKKFFIIYVSIISIFIVSFSLGLFVFNKYYKINTANIKNEVKELNVNEIKNDDISSYVKNGVVYLSVNGKEEVILKDRYIDKNGECEQRISDCENTNKNKDCSGIKSDVKVIVGTENGPKETNDYDFCIILYEYPLKSRISINKRFVHILVGQYETAGNYVYDINSKEIHEITGQTDCGLGHSRWLDDGNLLLFGQGGICGGGVYISLDPNKPWDMRKIGDGNALIDDVNFPKE